MDADFIALGVLVRQVCVGPALVVAEAELPEGASPPAHIHRDLDDSFYVLSGRMVVRCGDDTTLAEDGTWVPFPRQVPHTFRVLDGPARILLVHTDDSFLEFFRAVGRPVRAGDVATTGSGPTREELDRLSLEHGIENVGPSMEEEEARAWLSRLRVGAA